jgi:hypothetical protein
VMIKTKTRNRDRPGPWDQGRIEAGEITAGWGVYLLSIAGLMIYSVLSLKCLNAFLP